MYQPSPAQQLHRQSQPQLQPRPVANDACKVPGSTAAIWESHLHWGRELLAVGKQLCFRPRSAT
jgi:hypothetical protein